ncbi:MAG: hypothetical protein HQL83_17285 [Magnetococcales bacterium]|nr:hypothetical protein [Magnetococcales bacterium]
MTIEQWVGVAGALIAFMAMWIQFFVNPVKEQMKGEANRKKYLAILSQPHLGDVYVAALSWCLRQSDRIFGPALFRSFKSFDRCLAFSFIYSFIFFYMGWLFGGSGQVGNVTLLNDVKINNKIKNNTLGAIPQTPFFS